MNIRITRQHAERTCGLAGGLFDLASEFSWDDDPEDNRDKIEEMQFMCAEIQRETSRLSSRLIYTAGDKADEGASEIEWTPKNPVSSTVRSIQPVTREQIEDVVNLIPREPQVTGYDNREEFEDHGEDFGD